MNKKRDLINKIIDKIPKKQRLFWFLTFVILTLVYWIGDIVNPDPIFVEEWLIPIIYAILANSLRKRSAENDSSDEEFDDSIE